MEQEQDQDAAQRTTQQTRGRGSSNKRGSRGRGKGRSQAPQAQARTSTSSGPSFQQRAAQVRSAEGTPHDIPTLPTIPLAQLSAAMDMYFPSSMEPHLAPLSSMIDCCGFADLCNTTYQALVSQDNHLEKLLSEPEFQLCCSQVLARHIIRVRTMALHQVIPGQENLLSAIPLETELPTPITSYMESLGVVRHTDGAVIVPNIVLPRTDYGAAFNAGMLPSLAADNFTTNTHWEFNSCMIQFGILSRAIENAHAGNQYNHNHSYDRLDPANANGGLDAHYARPACLPTFMQFKPMSRDRIGALTLAFRNEATLLGTLRYNPQLFQQFELFLDKAKAKCSLTKLPVSTAGTPAFFAWAVPTDGDDINPPNQFDYFSTINLSNAEQHASRLFRYRQRRTRNDNCSEPAQADRDSCYDASHTHLKHSTLSITNVPAYTSYLGHYVRHFMKGV